MEGDTGSSLETGRLARGLVARTSKSNLVRLGSDRPGDVVFDLAPEDSSVAAVRRASLGRSLAREDTVLNMPASTPVRLFCGYHLEDRSFFERLRAHLATLIDNNVIEVQHSGGVPAGVATREFLEKSLAAAQIVVLLVSVDLTSDKLWPVFWTGVVKNINPERVRLVPILVRSVELSNTALDGHQLLPRHPNVALSACPDRDAAWTGVAIEIREAAEGIRQTISSAPAAGGGSPAAGKTSLEDVRNQRERAHGLKYRGRSAEALEELHLAQAKLDGLIDEDPHNILLKKECAHLHDRIAQCEYSQGRFDLALAAFERASDIRNELCTSCPDDTEAQFDLSTSHFWRGYLSYLMGDLSRARTEQWAGVHVCRTLYERDENDLKAARSLVVLQTDLGTTLRELGDNAGAGKHLRDALTLVRKLAAQSPEDRQLQRDLSVGLFRLADLLVALDETTGARRACEESIQICWALTEWAPTNVQWRRHLATARVSMGDVRLSCKDLTLARGDYEFATGTMGALAALELDNLQGTRHYANAERKLGELLRRAEDHPGALAAYARAAAAMEAACSGANSDRWNRELHAIYGEQLRAHQAVPGADPGIAARVKAKAALLRARLVDAGA